MQKLIFCNLDMLKYEPDREDYEKSVFFDFDIDRFREKRARFMREFKELSEESGNRVFFYSRKRDLLIDFSDAFHKHGYTNFQFRDRYTIEEVVKSNKDKNNYFVFIGGKNVDFQLAVNTRSLYIVPTWLFGQ